MKSGGGTIRTLHPVFPRIGFSHIDPRWDDVRKRIAESLFTLRGGPRFVVKSTGDEK